MRVAIDLRPLLEPFESGVTVYTKAMVDELLQRRDVEVDLFYQASSRCAAIHARYPQVRWIQLSNTAFHARSVLRFPSLPADYFPRRPDLIWLPDRRPFYRTEIPLVMTIHDQTPERFRSSLSLKSRLWHAIFSLRRLLALSSGLLFPSLTVAQAIQTKLPWEVTYEGARLAAHEERPKGVGGVRDGFVFSLAPLDPRKRLHWVFELARRFPKTTFLCAGVKKGERRFSGVRVPSLPNVLLLPAISEAEKTWLFRYAGVFLALSAYEGFDLPVLEAVQAKTPVILSDIGVHRELYKNAVFVRDVDEAQAALYSALEGFGKVPQVRGAYSWKLAAERALLFFVRVLLHKDRESGGHRHSQNHSHHA